MRDGTPARRHRWPAGLRLVALGGAVVVLLALTGIEANRLIGPRTTTESPAAAPLTGPGRLAQLAAPAATAGPGGRPDRNTLVLYDQTGGPQEQNLAHQYAIQAANLASRGGAWTLRPIQQYRRGDLVRYDAAIYIGLDDGRLPSAFLADVARGRVPLLWMGTQIEQLFEFDGTMAKRLGWSPVDYDTVDVTSVEYGGRLLKRQAEGNDPPMRIWAAEPGPAEVLGRARHEDGSSYPWAVRSRDLTYIGEIPFSYTAPGDRYLAAADIILQLVAPDAPQRRRALIRIEDVGPNTAPGDITAIADFLSSRSVPFSLAVYPYYRDPHGASNSGRPTAFRLVDRPELVDALKYATKRGGTIIMHGYTHQYEDQNNPYTGTSGGDFEFYLAHVDEGDNVRLDGPVPPDSEEWAAQRISVSRGEFVRAGLDDPAIFEFPHYTASQADYRAVHKIFGVRYDQGSYFDGQCPAGDCTNERQPPGEMFQQFFPYPVRDVYGSVVIPENLLNISEAFNNNPERTAKDVVAAAAAMTVVRDSVASTFYHPFLGVERLAEVVDGISALGFKFVSPYEVIGVSSP